MTRARAAVALWLLATLAPPAKASTSSLLTTNTSLFGAQPAARAGAVAGYVPSTGTTLLFGGTTGSALLNDVWEYSYRWVLLNGGQSDHAPRARTGHAGGVVGSSLFVFGGQTGDGQLLNDAWLFDPTAAAWTLLLTASQLVVPAPRAGHSVAVVNASTVLVFGGAGPGTSILTDVWAATLVNATGIQWAPVHAGQSAGGASSSPSHPTLHIGSGLVLSILTLHLIASC